MSARTSDPELATPARSCGKCGCTDAHACLGPGGTPCHWVTAGLCSACLAKMVPAEELERTEALLALEGDIVGFRLNGIEAFQLLAALQLVCRHPEFKGHTRGWVEAFARDLQLRLTSGSTSGTVAELLDQGWNPAFDVEVGGSSLIIPS